MLSWIPVVGNNGGGDFLLPESKYPERLARGILAFCKFTLPPPHKLPH